MANVTYKLTPHRAQSLQAFSLMKTYFDQRFRGMSVGKRKKKAVCCKLEHLEKNLKTQRHLVTKKKIRKKSKV